MTVKEYRRRYLLFKWRSESPIKQSSLSNALWSSIMKLYGEVGASQTSLKIIDFNIEDKIFIARCSHKSVEMVRAGAAVIRDLDGQPIVLYSIGVSGTMKTLRDKFFKKRF